MERTSLTRKESLKGLGATIVLGIICIFLLVCQGCATGSRIDEMQPILRSRTGDPRMGLIIISGTNSAIIEFYDRAGRLVEEWSEAGASPHMTINGRYQKRVYRYTLPVGSYRGKIRPFYYKRFPKRRLVEMPVRNFSVRVDEKCDTYDREHTMSHWGWVLKINVGNIPREHTVLPKVDISGTGLFKILLDFVR
ncbi:hypothetical protein ACFLZC_01340 [Patescibacteria group bacterium]